MNCPVEDEKPGAVQKGLTLFYLTYIATSCYCSKFNLQYSQPFQPTEYMDIILSYSIEKLLF